MIEYDARSLETKYQRLFEASQENRQKAAAVYDRIHAINEYIRVF